MPQAPVRERLALILVGTLIGLLLAELAVRLLGLGPPAAPRRVVYRGVAREWCCGPEREWGGVRRFEPNTSFAHCYGEALGGAGCVTYGINAEGWRGPGFSVAKPRDAYRIVVLGDSFTFGEGTPDALVYPAQLGERLRERRAAGRRIEVVNLGFPGEDIRDALATYRRYARRLAPDFVVLQWNTNDFPSARVQRDHLQLIGVRYREVFAQVEALRWSRLLAFGYGRLRMRQLSRELVAATRGEAETRRDAFAAIGELHRLAARDGAGFAVLVFPELIRFDAYPYAALIELLHEYCVREAIVLVDLLPALSAHRDRALWVHESDHHPNALAHAIAARELGAALEPLLPPAE
jgi:lysophospholipase L1-like esterase